MGYFGAKKTKNRYDGKPFLKLVDSFVLKCIGKLDPDQEAILDKLTPKFQETFKCTGTWEEIVIVQLEYPPSIRNEISRLWVKNQEIARINSVSLSPMQFVEMFVAKNITES